MPETERNWAPVASPSGRVVHAGDVRNGAIQTLSCGTAQGGFDDWEVLETEDAIGQKRCGQCDPTTINAIEGIRAGSWRIKRFTAGEDRDD